MKRGTLIGLLCTVALALFVVPAFAQSPTQGGYCGNECSPPPLAHHDPSVTVSRVHRLPFTGVDIRLIVLGGITLLGAGFAMRRGSRPHLD